MKQMPRAHPLWFAYILHRMSGLDGFLHLTDVGMVKLAEFGLVFLLAVHMFGGLRLMAMEWLPWSAPQKTLAAGVAAVSFLIATLFLMKAI